VCDARRLCRQARQVNMRAQEATNHTVPAGETMPSASRPSMWVRVGEKACNSVRAVCACACEVWCGVGKRRR